MHRLQMKLQFGETNRLKKEESNPSNPLLGDRMKTICSHTCQDVVEVDVLLGGCVTQEEMQNALHVLIHCAHK